MPFLPLPLTQKPGDARIDWSKPLTQGLVGFWPLPEGGGVAHDQVYGEPLTASGTGVGWSSGPLGPRLRTSASGVGDYWSTAANARYVLNGARSFAALVTPQVSWNADAAIMAAAQHLDDSELFLRTLWGSIVWGGSEAWTPTSISASVGTDATPHFLVGTWDASNSACLYVDGRLAAGPTTLNTVTNAANSQFFVGRRGYNADQNFACWVDLPAVWNRALTAGEVRQLSTDPLGSLLAEPRLWVGIPAGAPPATTWPGWATPLGGWW